MPELAAIIPAAGFSSRMGVFKPLLPIGESPALEKPILAFKNAGIDDIKVVVGHKGDLLAPVLQQHQVDMVVNPVFQSGMFSSIQAGLRAVQRNIDAFFVLPADYPFVRPETIKEIALRYGDAEGEIIRPCFQGKRGHPPLVTAKLIPTILASHPNEGLRSILQSSDFKTTHLDVNDPGILQDMDTKADYDRLAGGIPPGDPDGKSR